MPSFEAEMYILVIIVKLASGQSSDGNLDTKYKIIEVLGERPTSKM